MAILFIDVENLYRSVGKRFNSRLDYDKYVKFLEARFGEPVTVKYAFGSQKPKDARGFVSLLKNLGFITKFEQGVNWNVPIALTAISLAQQGSLVVLGSSNKDLAPLVEVLQSKGARVFVCGCSIHPGLKNMTEYHEVTEDLLIRENQDEAPATA
jgi:uncharacterized LabA/DUF88 family protein